MSCGLLSKADTPLTVGERVVPLADLLAGCLRTGNASELDDPELADAQRVFLAAGLAALARPAEERRWVQIGLSPGTVRDPELYGALHDFAAGLLDGGVATGFFFMHKRPGLRVRFQAPPGGHDKLAERVRHWAGEPGTSGVYEAEAGLFGGRHSMRYAHELFTADSLAWLRVHRRPDARTAPAWVTSLLMIRAVLDGLWIAGWEDRDVWDRVRSEAGRRLPDAVREHAGIEAGLDTAVHGIRRLWEDQDLLTESLPDWAREIVAGHRVRATDVCRRWRTEFFDSHAANVGPRHATAFHVVFHWNRAGLSGERQILLAEALGTREPARG